MRAGTSSHQTSVTGYRWMILLLIWLLVLAQMVSWYGPAPLLTAIQQSLSVELGKAGTLVTLVSLISGIFMFSGSLVIDRLGLRAAAIIPMVFMLVGGGLSYFATSYFEIFSLRLIVGIGVGLATPLAGTLTMAWFPAREQPYINSFHNVLGFIGISIAFGTAAPLLAMTGSWSIVLGVFAGLPLLAAAGWLVLGRNPPATIAEPAAAMQARQESGIMQGARRSEVWLLTAAMVGMLWVFGTFSTFLPTFLETVRGLSRVDAGVLTSVMPLAGVAGALICGFGTGMLGRRKAILLPLMVVTLVAALAIVNLPVGPLVYVSIAALGFAVSGASPILMTTVMDLKGATPQLIGGALAFIFGISFTSSFFVSPAFGALVPVWGIPLTMMVFSLPGVLAVVSIAILPETGPKGRAQR